MDAEDSGRAWIPALAAALVSLLPNPAAAVPLLSYYFRDFAIAFYPQRLFAAREWAEGRWPLWNPYIHEGAFALPALYPPDLLHVFLPGPAWVSWLLTLHLPLAALAAFALARELSLGRWAAFLAGAVYATGGLALSSLNLYVFLQALAWAPLVALTLRRAAAGGGRWLVLAGVVTAVSVATLAVEFVAQAVVLGVALGLAGPPRWRRAGRLLGALALGAGLAAVPMAIVLGLLGETARGAGLAPEVALANDLHPAVLLQTLVPDLFGKLSSPVEAFWGGAFFSKGFPYFLSLYLGPLVLALAVTGAGGPVDPHRRIVVALGALGLWYALGSAAGLAPLVSALPGASSFRFPVKALLLPHLAVALLAAWGLDRLLRGEGWRTLRYALAAGLLVLLGLAALAFWGRSALGAALHVSPAFIDSVAAVILADGVRGALFVAAALGLGWAAARGGRSSRLCALLLAALAAFDLVRGGRGLNPQATPRFFEPVPELSALELDRLDGARVFTYGADWSPAFLEFLRRPAPGKAPWSFFVSRQLLSPYANVLDRVELAQSKDLTSFAPHPGELGPDDYQPQAFARILPQLRQSAVTRVLSLDPLDHPALSPLAVIPAGPPGLSIHAYAMEGWPRAFLACRVQTAADVAGAYAASLQPSFDPRGEVALEQAGSAGCRSGAVRRTGAVPSAESYAVEADGEGWLVIRASFARGWRAAVDGRPAEVRRANGKHMAVAVPAGRHQVEIRYEAPGRRAGLAVTAAAVLAALALSLRRRPER